MCSNSYKASLISHFISFIENTISLNFFQANLGNLDRREDCISLVISNLALVQCQGIVVGFVASIVAVIMDFMKGGELDLDHTLLLCASAVVTASIASFLLGLVMVAVIILCRRCHINPDNVRAHHMFSRILNLQYSIVFSIKITDMFTFYNLI